MTFVNNFRNSLYTTVNKDDITVEFICDKVLRQNIFYLFTLFFIYINQY